MEIAIRRCTKKYVCLKYIGKILKKKLSFHSSGDSSSVTTDIGDTFSIWPHNTSQKSLRCGVMMGQWRNITLVSATFTPNYGVMVSHWIFSFLLQLITLNENNFWRWLSEVVPVGWHIDFVFSSYGWYVKAKFVIFGCFLPHLTIDFFYKDLYNRFLLLKNYRFWHWIRSFVWFIPTNLESLIFD